MSRPKIIFTSAYEESLREIEDFGDGRYRLFFKYVQRGKDRAEASILNSKFDERSRSGCNKYEN